MRTLDKFFEGRHGPLVIISSILKVLKNNHGEFAASSSIPFSFSRKGKEYKGYYAFGEDHTLRFEFNKGQLSSISVWDTGTSLSNAPKYTVSVVLGNAPENISQITDAIFEGNLSVEEATVHASKTLQEAAIDDVRKFVAEVGDDGGTFSSLYKKYIKWAEENELRVVSDITFIDSIKRLRSTGGSGERTKITILPGVSDDPVDQPVEYDEFEQEILNNNVLYKYEMMNEIVKKIVTWDPLYRNAFIYGVGGVGKTYTITQVVNNYSKEGEVVVYKGAISGFTGLLQVLWQNRTRKIIIFDDNDAIINIPAALNLLKGAMENSDPRIISYIRFKRGAPSKKEEGLIIDVSKLHEKLIRVYENGCFITEQTITGKEKRWYEAVTGKNYSSRNAVYEALDIADAEDEYEEDDFGDLDPDVDPAYGMSADDNVPDQFQFTSRVIFISNLMQVPQPLLDRCITIGLLLTKQQILDLVENKLEHIMTKEAPEVTLETKKEVLTFMRKYIHRIAKPLTFRLFMSLCAIKHSNHPNAEKMMYMTFMAEGMKTSLR